MNGLEPRSGTQVQLEFGLREMTVETDARIIYRNAPEEHRAPSLALGCGVLFEGIDSDDQERIRNFVRRRAARCTV